MVRNGQSGLVIILITGRSSSRPCVVQAHGGIRQTEMCYTDICNEMGVALLVTGFKFSLLYNSQNYSCGDYQALQSTT